MAYEPEAGPQPSNSLIRLWKVAAGCDREDLLEAVSDSFLEKLLVKFPPVEVLCRIEKMEKALQELRDLEKQVNRGKIKEIFASGAIFARGTSTDGNPIVWVRGWRRRPGGPDSVEYLLCFFWVWVHVRRYHASFGKLNHPILIFDQRGGTLEDINIPLLCKIAKISDGLFPLRDFSTLAVYEEIECESLLKEDFVPLMAESFQTSSSSVVGLDDVNNLLADPGDVANFFEPSRRTLLFQSSWEMQGPFQRLLNKCGFSWISLRDLACCSVYREESETPDESQRLPGRSLPLQKCDLPIHSLANTGGSKLKLKCRAVSLGRPTFLESSSGSVVDEDLVFVDVVEEECGRSKSFRGLGISTGSRDLEDERSFGIPSVRAMTRTRSRWSVSPMSPVAASPDDDEGF